MRVKQYAFAAASVALMVLALASPALAAQGNAKPCLAQPSISPMTGTARTVYVAQVTYRDPDGDVPAKVEVYIDNVAYPMRLAGGRAASGTYRARLTLPPGEHSWFFYAEDVRGQSERFPRYGARKGPFVGKTKPMNRLPILTEGGVRQGIDNRQNVYTYTVRYKDFDCPPSPTVRVVVDGIVHDMKLHSGKPNDGIYIYQTTLPAGPHAYYFMAKDRNGDCVTHPANGFIRGPEIMERSNTPPMAQDQRVEPPTGGMRTRYGYLVNYRDYDMDAPSLALVYVNGFPYQLKLVKGDAYDGLYAYYGGQFLGNLHDYYFYFEDGRGGACRFPNVGTFHGPVVTR
jgi:hypothetical protein